MIEMSKRILWLLNNLDLRDFEVPMLLKLGFEVFTPKICPASVSDEDLSVTWEYDSTLSIPVADLEFLNQCDMYARSLPQRAVEIMNQYFDFAFFDGEIRQTEMLVRSFKGILLLRALGLDNDLSYTELFGKQHVVLLDDIRRLGNRFWFAAIAPGMADKECDFFQRQEIYLPVGAKEGQAKDIWIGDDKRILFNCPGINTNSQRYKEYAAFRRDLGEIPHIVNGTQFIRVSGDPTVQEPITAEESEQSFKHMAAFYYPARQVRYRNSALIQAIESGMPVVFLAGGILDCCGGQNLPGRCKTVAQAKQLLKRLSAGDKRLAKHMITAQKYLQEFLDATKCADSWNQAFARLLMTVEQIGAQRKQAQPFKCKIAVVIPLGYTGGVLDFSVRLALAIQKGAKEAGDHVDVVLYHMDTPAYQEKDYFKDVKNAGIRVQTYKWTYKNRSWFGTLASLKRCAPEFFPKGANIMEDGIQNLQDFDYCIFTSDCMPFPAFCVARYAVVVHDVIQRYVPDLLDVDNEALRQANNRRADGVIVTTPYMIEEAVNYCGIERSKVTQIPPAYAAVDAESSYALESHSDEEQYFIWATNPSQHKNHLTALAALSEYYAQGGKIKCYITGALTEMFSPDYTLPDVSWAGYVEKVRRIIEKDSKLKKNIVLKGEMEKNTYLRCLANAVFIFHPGYADNGNGACVDALQLGVPALSSKYPPMEYMNERLNAHMTMCAPHDAEEMAEKLMYMEHTAAALRKELPSVHELQQFMIEGQYGAMYSKIRTMIRGY